MSKKLNRQKFEQVPLSLANLSLGTIGLGFAWNALLSHFAQFDEIKDKYNIASLSILVISVIFSLLYALLVISKFILNKKQFVGFLRTPKKAGSVFALFMVVGVFGNFLGFINVNYFDSNFAFSVIVNIIISFGSLCHVFSLIYFVNVVLAKHDLEKDEMYASWFLPLVGLGIACNFYDNIGIDNQYYLAYFQVLWLICAILFIGSFFLFGYKQYFKGYTDKNDYASMAIMAVGPNLLLIGFTKIFNPLTPAVLINFSEQAFQIFIYLFILFSAISLFIYILSMIKMLVIHNSSFAWTAFGFSGAITTIAIFDVLDTMNAPTSFNYILYFAGISLISIVSLVITFLNIKALLSFKPWFEYKTQTHTSGMI
ncbi:permease [Mycoplasma sp. T363T]|uniref:Permease n=1 Tax=Mycoplasma bradburyae TaxID=2963128 RepID=A0ABT5GAW6_9MOLU|nr:permease [Mycoplasma bradburyae]MDC4163422.1 permease [Mycoplasma bradburyae]MDC4182038.1 permease [Mycoplasma bradburyae]UTS70463.1 permease [Mycoplasma bradburyae]